MKQKSLNYFDKRNASLSFKKKREFVNTIPKNALVELTNACNHECVFCYNPEMKRKIGSLDINLFETFVKKSCDEGLEEIGLYATGEPFMTKNLPDFIKIAKNNGIKRVYITSNGALASIDKVKKCLDAGLDSIKFSINAGTKESYKIIHGYDDFEKVIHNVKEIHNYVKMNNLNVKLLCTFIYTNLTYNEIDSFSATYGKYFDERIGFYQASNQGGLTTKKNIVLTKRIPSKSIKNQKYKPCEMLWNRIHLNNKGYLTACCVDYENNLTYKKLSEDESVLDQFNAPRMIELRKKHLTNQLDGTICKNCIYNTNEMYKKIIPNSNERNITVKKKKIDHLNQRINKIAKDKLIKIKPQN